MSDYKQPRKNSFAIGADTINKEINVDSARQYGMRLAIAKHKNVIWYCFNEGLGRWDNLGTYTPLGYFVDSFGYVNTINKEGNGFDHFGKFGVGYTQQQVEGMVKPYGSQIVKSTIDEIVFDNGVTFTWDKYNKFYRISRGADLSYSKNLDT